MEPMDGDDHFTIGELARRTGLSVRTIRFYSDAGVVPPSGRSPAGYRLYDTEALARLETARTLRDLGLDLETITRVLDRELTLGDVVTLHAHALDTQIRILRLRLRLRRAVLWAVVKRNTTLEEMELMHKLARLSEEERNRLLTDFYDEVFGGLNMDPELEQRMRSVTPDLPDDPTPEQVEAWIELAELVQEPGFRRRVRAMSEAYAAVRDEGPPVEATPGNGFELVVADRAGQALAAGVDPQSAEATEALRDIVDAMRGESPDTPELRATAAKRFTVANDARVERYWQLLGMVNGWPAFPSMTPAFAWTIEALQAHPRP